jgi:hypothetical protein
MPDLPSREGDDMRHDVNHPRCRASLAAAGVLVSLLLVSACGGGSTGPGVAGAGSSTGAASSSAASKRNTALAYSKCIRSHGVPDFPDPDSKGQVQINAGPGSDLAPDSPQFKKAQQACKSLEPSPPSAAEQQRDYAKAIKFARCMRSHGVTDLPDPMPPGTAPKTQSQRGSGGGGPSGIDPNSPVFKKAQQACQSLQPGGASFSTHSEGGAS